MSQSKSPPNGCSTRSRLLGWHVAAILVVSGFVAAGGLVPVARARQDLVEVAPADTTGQVGRDSRPPADQTELFDQALGRFLALEQAAADSVDLVLRIEARVLAEEAEDLAAWGEWDLARELLGEAGDMLVEAGVTLPGARRETADAPSGPPADARPAGAGTEASEPPGS